MYSGLLESVSNVETQIKLKTSAVSGLKTAELIERRAHCQDVQKQRPAWQVPANKERDGTCDHEGPAHFRQGWQVSGISD